MTSNAQRTLLLLKPDAVRRGLVGNLLSRFETKGLQIVALDLRTITGEQADEHYAEHVGKDFYPPLRDFVTSGPMVAAVLEGDEAIEVVRLVNGATDGRKAAPGTIRGDLSLSNRENLVHGSDSPESAEREIKLWFPEPALTDAELSPTERSSPRRERERAQSDRSALYDVLDASLICHLAVVVDGVPLALPTMFAVDADGPDEGGTLYLHGSVASRSLVQAPDQEVSVTMTVLDGLVLARSGFNHSMNYRSAVVIGRPRRVDDPDERLHALDLMVEHAAPGRAAELRRPTRKELAATTVLALPLHEASVKRRTGDPSDEDSDVETGGVWAGVLPLRVAGSDPVTSADAPGLPVPEHVVRRARGLR